MTATSIISKKIDQLEDRLLKTEYLKDYWECRKLQGGIFYLEQILIEIMNKVSNDP